MLNLADKIAARKSGAPKKAPKIKEQKQKITTGGVLKYMFLPNLGSRIRDIGKRLGGFAHFLALIFNSCGLIPNGHPTLQSANIGYFGFSDVISEAAANLQMRRENADQIIMFSAVILSMVLLVANGLAIAAYTVLDFGTAFAQNVTATTATASGSMFVAPHADTDLALKFLDRVFGTTGVALFNTGTVQADPIKDALYHMLGLYSQAMMVVAVIIVLYYAFTVVGESAQTGQPFGKRFNSFWAPIRLVVGLGLLVPIAGGLNAAQYITLYAAKLGSGFASYAWSGFVQQLANSDLVSKNTPYPSVSELVYSVVRFETCAAVVNEYNLMSEVTMHKEVASGAHGARTGTIFRWDKENPALANTSAALNAGINAVGGAGVANIIPGGAAVTGAAGAVSGLSKMNTTPAACGEIFIPDQAQTISKSETSVLGSPEVKASMKAMHDSYVSMVEGIITQVREPIETAVKSRGLVNKNPGTEGTQQELEAVKAGTTSAIAMATIQVQQVSDQFANAYDTRFKQQIRDRISSFDDKGWLGAGMFFTQIADLNGGLLNAVQRAFPRVTGNIVALPSEEEMKDSTGLLGGNSTVKGSQFDNETVRAMTKTLTEITKTFSESDNPELTEARGYRRDFFTMIIVDLFGGKYLDNMRQSDMANPLAELTALGHGLMTKGLDYVGFILMGLLAGPALSIIGAIAAPASGGVSIVLTVLGVAAGALKAVAGFLIFTAMIGFSVGVMLYYIVPIIPLVYFFFAVLEWILGVVEAMVGLPLWALAHIRIDGDGLSGQAAQTGYMAIFGIIVRPFVILFALIVCIIAFSAAMTIFKEMFSVYVGLTNAGESGSDSSAIDYMAFSGIYAVLAFTVSQVCFKQCDQMPKQIMRWFGTSDPRYDDGQADPEGALRNAAFGLGATTLQATGNINQMVSSMSDSVSGGAQKFQTGKEQKAAEKARVDQDGAREASADRRHQELMDRLGGPRT